MIKQEYIDNEELQLEILEEKLVRLKNKWFKSSSSSEEIEFLKTYIELKSKMIEQLR